MLPRRYPANVGYFSFIIDKTLNSRSYHTLTSFWLDLLKKSKSEHILATICRKHSKSDKSDWSTPDINHIFGGGCENKNVRLEVLPKSALNKQMAGLFQRSGLFTICLAFQKDLMTTNYVRVFSRRLVICALSKLIPRISPIIEKRWHTLI